MTVISRAIQVAEADAREQADRRMFQLDFSDGVM